jgi:ribonuclease BN (tRNA processing enzyme)
MGSFRFIPLGVGDAFSARHYSSCLALEAADSWLLIDCPHPIRKIMREASATAGVTLDVDRIAGICLTHLHADHCSGLEGIGLFARFLLERQIPLLAHPSVSEWLWQNHLANGMGRLYLVPGEPPKVRHLEDFFDLIPLSEAAPTQFGPFTIETRPTVHSLPTTAFRIRAARQCLGYSADKAFDPSLIEWLSAADLIVHETGPGLLHTPYHDLVVLPATLRNRMRSIHYPDNFDVAASIIEPLVQGHYYSVWTDQGGHW